ncbi:MAG: uncharacterized protein QOE54_4814 [Streptosporangiaceae bacterium]|nr:uncharacterized protein [Streptosporangiaceae bacterium]
MLNTTPSPSGEGGSPPSPARPESRMLPAVKPLTRDFWTGGEKDELRIHRCHSCGHFFHPPSPICFRCQSFDVGAEPVSGRATLVTFTVNHQQWLPGFPPPYVVGIVEIEEEPGVRLTSNIVGCEPDQVEIGMPVEVIFEHWEDVWLPLFRPVDR